MSRFDLSSCFGHNPLILRSWLRIQLSYDAKTCIFPVINNSCNDTPVPVFYTSQGVNTSLSDDTEDKNHGISGSSSLLMNRVPRWGQVSCPASFRKHGIEESSSNNPSKQKACQQSVEPTVKRKGAKDAIKALTSKLMYSSTHGTCDIKARDINNSCNATPVPVLHTSHGVNTSPSDDTGDKNCGILGSSSLLMNRVPRWGQVSSPASFRKHGKEESSSNNPSKQKACQQSVEPTVKRKGAKDAIKALTSKLQSMSPRAFMRKQAKAHVNTPTCAKQLMYRSTHGTSDIEARDINNSCNATPVSVLHTSHGVNTSPSDVTGDKNRGISGTSYLLMNRVPRWGQVSSPASFRKHGKEESSSNNPSKQKACQQSVEPTVKCKGAKDAIKALTSKLQSMSPRAFMRKQAKAHVDTPTCARQLIYSSTHKTCDIEARDINNSFNATPVPVLHTSHGVNTSPSDDTGDKNRRISGLSSLLMNRVPRWGQVSYPASFRKHGIKESSSNNPSKQKACQQSVEPTVKHKGAKDAIKALTSKLQSMSPSAFIRKQAKAHVDTPTCARKLMYSSTHKTYDIEARDINNSCNATLVPVLHTSHGVNTSPSDDTRVKNYGISGSSSLLMNRVPRWGQVSSPASFRKHGKKESSSNNPSKQKACQQSVEPTIKVGAEGVINGLDIKGRIVTLQSMSPRAFMQKQANAHVDTPTCARQLMYSSTHGTCDIEAMDINNSCNATPVPVLHTSHGVNTSPSNDIGDKNRGISGSSSLLMNRVPRWGQVSCPASFRKHGKEESSSNNPSKQKACQQSVEPTVKRKGAKDAIKALTSKLQSMSPRAFMRKQAKAHVNTPTCAKQLMYSSTHGTCDIEARDNNNSCNATHVSVLHTSHGVNTSPSDELVVRSTLTEQVKQIQEWMEQYRPVRNSFGKERQRGGGKITNKKYTNITMLMATSTRYSFKSKANS
ncbi:hypothetical protein Tco_0587862 [Tanacetum coccineum]